MDETAAAVQNMSLNGSADTKQEVQTDNSLSMNLPHSAKDGLVKTPLDTPLDACKPTVRPALTADETTKYNTLLATVSGWTEVPDTLSNASKKAPLTDSERMFLTKECLLRYLRADKWNLAQAETRLRNTISWRREYGVERFTPDYISPENETGKQVVMGWDTEGRPCQYLRPSKQNTPRSDRQIEHLVYMLERTIDLMPPGQETLVLLINFAETKTGQGVSLTQGKQTMYILQNHYPERLGRALVANVPFMVNGFFKLIQPFIDPLTRVKIKFNEDFGLYVPREQLMKEAGGEVNFEYDHTSYWPSLNKLCDIKRQQYRERWEKAGKHIGESEVYLRGGDARPVSEETSTAQSNDNL